MAAYFSPVHPTPRSTPPQGRRSPRPAELTPTAGARGSHAGGGAGRRRSSLAAHGRRCSWQAAGGAHAPRPELAARTQEVGSAGGPRQEEGRREEELAAASRGVGKRMRMKRV
jgi:hypothetical protein